MQEELDYKKQNDYTRELGNFLYNNYWTVPIAYGNTLFGVSSKVGELKPRVGMAQIVDLEYIVPAQ